MPNVAVIMGSTSDRKIIQHTLDMLEAFKIDYEYKVLSAHRTLNLLLEYLKTFEERGGEIVIAAAGYAAHLPGIIAANISKPVIGIPLASSHLNGLDSLFSIVQMPSGIPVATVTIGEAGAKNAAILAAEILSIKYPVFVERLKEFRKNLQESVEHAQ